MENKDTVFRTFPQMYILRTHAIPKVFADVGFAFFENNIEWDDRIKARKTASFGVPYNYSGINYEYKKMPNIIETMCRHLDKLVGFMPNNCLLNFYENGDASMGFHSDNIEGLEEGTGIIIISLGASRVLKFEPIPFSGQEPIEFILPNGSLFYMSQEVQMHYKHSIPKDDTEEGRISLTFRRIKQ